MKRYTRQSLLVLLTCVLAAAPTLALKVLPPPAHVSVQHGWIRWLPAGLPAAGYAIIRNNGDQPMRLMSVESPDYAMVMLHRSTQASGNDSMEMVESITIPAHGEIRLAPGGYHLMLTSPKRPIKPGDKVQVRLIFASHEMLMAMWTVRPANAS